MADYREFLEKLDRKAYHEGEWQWQEDGYTVTRTTHWSPPGCHMGCGVLLYTKEGKLERVEGDPLDPCANGRLCMRCLNLAEGVNYADRPKYPLRRAGERGEDKWERITWEEALDEIADWIHENLDEAGFGRESIFVNHGTGRNISSWVPFLGGACLGTPNIGAIGFSGYSCYLPRTCGTAAGIGDFPIVDASETHADRYGNAEWVPPEVLVVWGNEPLASNADGYVGHWLVQCVQMGTKIISIDPRITWVGAHDGNINLQVRPQTDTALALAIMNLMFETGEYDQEFAEKWIYGLDDMKARAAEYPVDKVAEITGVDAEDIKRVAHIIGTERPIGWAWGLAFDQNKNGVQLSQAFIVLAALAGSIDRPGGLTLGPPSALLGKWRMEQRGAMADDVWQKRIGAAAWPGLSTGMATTQPDETLNTMETDQPYALKMGWFNSSNFLTPTCSAQPKRWHKALQKLEFVVVQDLTMTPTAMAVGDYFLPMATWAEHNGIVLTHYGRNTVFMGPMNKALQVGECKSDVEICLMFGQRLNPSWWPWYKPADGKSLDLDALAVAVEDFYSDQLKELGMDWNQFREEGLYQPGAHGFEYEKYEKGLLRFDGEPGFNTITGQIEAYSILYESWGEDPLPYYEEPNYSPISKPDFAGQYPLITTSGSRRYSSFHSEHRHVPSLRQIDPWPWVQINPETAAEYGITDGDWCEVYNMFGEARFKAEVTPVMKPGILNCAHGWWFPEQDGEEPNLFGVWKSNFNSLVPHFNVGKLGFGAPYKGVMCNVRRVRSLDQD